MEPKWYNVNADARVWAGHSDAHKQGWMRAPAAVLAVEEYKGSVRFDDWKLDGDGAADFDNSMLYPEFWMRLDELSLEPYDPTVPDPIPTPDPVPTPDPTPVPGEVSDSDLGAAFRLIVDFILGR